MNPRFDVVPTDGRSIDRAIVRALGRRTRRAARAMSCARDQIEGLTVRIVDDPAMRLLKQEHFGIDEATDVLSFPAGDPIPGESADGAQALGELVINRDAVSRQAGWAGLGHTWLDEATQLLIHGIAHLLGHDHDRRDRARRMLARERRGCAAVGLRCVRPYGRGR